jgi:DNA-binding transcriptional regulator YiaG
MTPETLKHWRERLSLSQVAAAATLGCCRKTYQNWERGRTKIPGHLVLALAAMERDMTSQKQASP